MRKLTTLIMLASFVFFYRCEKDGEETKSSEKEILQFRLEQISPPINGVINEQEKTIVLSDITPVTDLTALVPTISISEGATVSPASQTAHDFTNPVVYTVTAEDGSTVAYTVTATITDIDTLSGSLLTNLTLVDRVAGDSADYFVDGIFSLNGNALLTINPGVVIRFTGVDGLIVVEGNAGLKMVGTAANPIILTGPAGNDNKGSWGGIFYRSSSDANQMEYVSVINAGSGTSDAAINMSFTARLSIRNSLISGSGNDGLHVRGTLDAFSNNVISGCEESPIVLEFFDYIVALDEASQLTGNGNSFVEIPYGFRDNQLTDLSLKKLTVPYFIDEVVFINRKLTIAPGTTMLFGQFCGLEVNSGGTLIANGTAELPIIFSQADIAMNIWGGITFYSSHENSLQHCIVEYADPGNIVIEDGAQLSIQNCTIRNTDGYGVIRHNSGTISSSSLTFSNCDSGNVYNADEDISSDTL